MSILDNHMHLETAYTRKVEQLVQDDQAKVAEMKMEAERAVKEIAVDYGNNLTIETLPFRRWLARFPCVTMKNVAPYSPNGDINNAIFTLPLDIDNRDLRPWLNEWRPFDLFVANNTYVWTPVTGLIGEECRTPQEIIRRTKLDKPETGAHRRQELEKYFLTKLDFTTTYISNDRKHQMEWRNKHREIEADMLPYRDFAERMAKCTADFESFCQQQ